MGNKKWNNYFGNIENKYNLKMNTNKPIVIFVDGKDITKSIKHNLIVESKNSFNDVFEQTIKFFSKKFNCIAISGVDEVSFIFENGKNLKKFISKRTYKAQDINSIFSQHFFKYFNDRYTNRPVYWHCKCSNIPKGKIKSYIKFRSSTIFELNLTYFLKRKQIKNAGKISLTEKVKKCNEFPEYKDFEKFARGNIYISGDKVDLIAYFNNQIVKLPEIRREEEITFLDLKNYLKFSK